MVMMTKAKPTEFKLYAPNAKKVYLAGSFNSWESKSLSAKKDSKGNWAIKVSLKPGKYEYKFFVDGSWQNDPRCSASICNSFGSQNNLIEVR